MAIGGFNVTYSTQCYLYIRLVRRTRIGTVWAENLITLGTINVV